MLAVLIGKLCLGLLVLAFSADRFVLGCVTIAQHRHWSPLLVGSVLMGVATTIPEILVSVMALMHGHIGISLGNALGSYITNIGLVLGICALVKPLKINANLFKQELPILTSTLLLTIILLLDRYLGKLDAIILLMVLIGLIVFVIRVFRQEKNQACYAYLQDQTAPMPLIYGLLWFIVGLVALLWSSSILVNSASALASWLGVGDLVIGLTIVAVGTSLPEMVTSIMCVRRGQYDMAFGNVIGSNVLGILAVVALPGLFAPGMIDANIVWRDCTAMLLITILMWVFAYNGGTKQAVISRLEGGVLFLFFLSYLMLVVIQSQPIKA